jgi:hypothetical protein
VQEHAVVLGPPHRADELRRRRQEPGPAPPHDLVCDCAFARVCGAGMCISV